MWWVVGIAFMTCVMNSLLMTTCFLSLKVKKDFWGQVGCLWLFSTYFLSMICLYFYLVSI